MAPLKKLRSHFQESARVSRRLDSLESTLEIYLSEAPPAHIMELAQQCADLAGRFGHRQEVADALIRTVETVRNHPVPQRRQADWLAEDIADAAAQMRSHNSENTDANEYYAPEQHAEVIALWRQQETEGDKIRGALTRQMADIWLSCKRADFQRDIQEQKISEESALLENSTKTSGLILRTASFWMRTAAATLMKELEQESIYPAARKSAAAQPRP